MARYDADMVRNDAMSVVVLALEKAFGDIYELWTRIIDQATPETT